MKSHQALLEEAQKMQLEDFEKRIAVECKQSIHMADFSSELEIALKQRVKNKEKIDSCIELAESASKKLFSAGMIQQRQEGAPIAEKAARYLKNPVYAIAYVMLNEIEKYKSHLEKEMRKRQDIIDGPNKKKNQTEQYKEAEKQLGKLQQKLDQLNQIEQHVNIMGSLDYDVASCNTNLNDVKLAAITRKLAIAEKSGDQYNADVYRADQQLLSLAMKLKIDPKDNDSRLLVAQQQLDLAKKTLERTTKYSLYKEKETRLNKETDKNGTAAKQLAMDIRNLKVEISELDKLIAREGDKLKNMKEHQVEQGEVKSTESIEDRLTSAEKMKNSATIQAVEDIIRQSKDTIVKKRFGKKEDGQNEEKKPGMFKGLGESLKGLRKSEGSKFIEKMEHLLEVCKVAQGIPVQLSERNTTPPRPPRRP